MRVGTWRYLVDGTEDLDVLASGWPGDLTDLRPFSPADLLAVLLEHLPAALHFALPDQASGRAPEPEAAKPAVDGDGAGQPEIYDVRPPGGPPAEPGPPLRSDGPMGVTFDPTVRLDFVDSGGAGVAYGDTFKLHSLPGSSYRIYLDFDGHTTTNTNWNSYWNTTSFYSQAFSTDPYAAFTEAELLRIQQIWARVAEYFAPFNIDVTTEDPGVSGLTYSNGDTDGFGIRVVITDEYASNKAYGGIAWVGSFDWTSDTPVFVYSQRLGPDSAKFIADAAAHEVGHSLGLSHDGRNLSTGTEGYYYGHGSGATDWAPVMGVGYNANIIQWSKGEYALANTTEDDLAIITSQNSGVAYRADDYGNTFASAAALTGVVANGVATVTTYGIISGSGTRNDVDMFSFAVGAGGSISLSVSAWTTAYVSGSSTPVYTQSPFSMLDVKMTLYHAGFGQLSLFDDAARIDGTLSLTGLAGGTYYLALDGTGWGDPLATTPTGYTEYGSLGQYRISGTYTVGTVQTVALAVDQASVTTTESGGGASFVVRAIGATGSVAVQITGLDGTEGALSASSLVLDASNGWAQTVSVTGRGDRDEDGAVSYVLLIAGGGATGTSVTVTNADNEIAPVSIGTGVTADGRRLPTASNASLAVLSVDDGNAMRISEGGAKGSYNTEWQWQFSVTKGTQYLLHADITSTERFTLDYYDATQAKWVAFAAAGLSWAGDYAVQATASTLQVRVNDVSKTSDTARNDILVDLLTLMPASPGDYLLA